MRISLLVDLVRQEEKLLINALSAGGVQYDVINVGQESLPFTRELGRYDVAVVRPVSMSRALYSSAVFQAAGVHCVNSPTGIALAGDKILTYSMLFKEGIPIPDSEVALSPDSTFKAYERRGFPLIDKPPIGSWGRLVTLVRDVIEGKAIIEHREMMGNSLLKVHIVQEYVNYRSRDIRCIVMGDEVLGCYARNIPKDDWRANVALGGVPSRIDTDEDLEKLARKAVKVVGGEFMSIDILEHESRGYLVNEINDVPEFKGFMVALNINVAERLVEYLKHKYG
ncbi:30S ribosomal protein S6 modification protein [Sulfodiicoccus acidiphilus]|uniref:30S ribosomal protein S6 modification protein n=1 Tax=Sulfodiicoccus acidiphilus TaxID=1670455 RepID=A0A348B0P9_9CREN|nr:lysine biosynthesis protein LysX [Sulfodiicoccus acidiphilus]BBD71751.1 30S ribosomal protein S6 modification protein [Sulfodiicoccus acidiphilus]GGT86159.1 30S ribosomal protein S6 modification protein [Sulfodiicoccus acidiphilus]